MFPHVTNETDRIALIALQEKIETLENELDYQETQALQDWKVGRPDYTEVNKYRHAKDEILSKYPMPEIADPYKDLYR